MEKIKKAYWILSGIFILEMIMILIQNLTRVPLGILALLFKFADSTAYPGEILGMGHLLIPLVILVFLISYIVLFVKNLKAEEKKIVVILPLLLCICFAFTPMISGNSVINNKRNEADRVIMSMPVLVDLSNIGLGEYRKVSTQDFGESYYQDRLYDTSEKVEHGVSPIFTTCSYEGYFGRDHFPNKFLKAEKYNYRGVGIYFLHDGRSDKMHVVSGGREYEIFSIYDRSDGDVEERKETIDGLRQYNELLEKVRNNPEFVPIKNEVEDVVEDVVKNKVEDVVKNKVEDVVENMVEDILNR